MKRKAPDTLASDSSQSRDGHIECLNGSKLEQLFFTGVLEDCSLLSKSYGASGPYKHLVIPQLMHTELLRNVRSEILENIHFTKKETDIYQVYQTGDLANIYGLSDLEKSRLKSVSKLRDCLYSPSFRKFLSDVTGCGPLSGSKKDMSVNIYKRGGHLLAHDDVIGTRKVSYILYLTDPDQPWKPSWGGSLRLYPTLRPNVPASDWTLSIPPAFNQLTLFEVQPGKSFHDVEEVYKHKDRMAISGWFHIPQPGEDGYELGSIDKAEAQSSLQQLQSHMNEHDSPQPKFIPFNSSSIGCNLEELISSKYLQNDVVARINQAFANNSKCDLIEFLGGTDLLKCIREEIESADMKIPHSSVEVGTPWRVSGPPHKQKFLYLSDSSPASSGFSTVIGMLSSVRFRKWLEQITGLTLKSHQCMARRFRPGFDYTLATDPGIKEPLLELTLSLTPNSAAWEGGGCGGYEVYMAGEDDGDGDADPSVYKRSDADDDSVLETNFPRWNALNLVFRDAGVLKFVKYCSRSSPGSRWDVVAQYEVEDEGQEEEENC